MTTPRPPHTDTPAPAPTALPTGPDAITPAQFDILATLAGHDGGWIVAHRTLADAGKLLTASPPDYRKTIARNTSGAGIAAMARAGLITVGPLEDLGDVDGLSGRYHRRGRPIELTPLGDQTVNPT